MNIPIHNIYYILCYAWNRLEARDIIGVCQLDRNDVASLFGKVMAAGVSRLLRWGLDRGYVMHSEETGRIRGRINFDVTLKTNFFSKPRLVCEYDAFDYNVLHNQILKATVRNLLSCADLKDDVRDELRDVFLRLYQIDDIVLTKRCFRLVQLNRNNGFYQFMLNVCELIFDNLLINKQSGDSRFRDFIQDEKQMRTIFEEFVRNFYGKHANEFTAGSKHIHWDAKGADEAVAFLPIMITDISLESPGRKIIIDTKYYKDTLNTRRGIEKIQSAHLYQMFAYLVNSRAKLGSTDKCEGILLYPTVSDDYHFEYNIHGHRLAVQTINLDQKWQMIHEDLLEIIRPVKSLCTN